MRGLVHAGIICCLTMLTSTGEALGQTIGRVSQANAPSPLFGADERAQSAGSQPHAKPSLITKAPSNLQPRRHRPALATPLIGRQDHRMTTNEIREFVSGKVFRSAASYQRFGYAGEYLRVTDLGSVPGFYYIKDSELFIDDKECRHYYRENDGSVKVRVSRKDIPTLTYYEVIPEPYK